MELKQLNLSLVSLQGYVFMSLPDQKMLPAGPATSAQRGKRGFCAGCCPLPVLLPQVASAHALAQRSGFLMEERQHVESKGSASGQ